MKKLLIVLMSLMMVLSLSACQKKEEVIDDNIPVSIPEDYQGIYTDNVAGRANVEVSEVGIIITWANSAAEVYQYEFPTTYDEANNQITYANGVLKDVVFAEDGTSTEEVVYSDGTGYFKIDGEDLIWHDDKENTDTTFVRVDKDVIGIPNPWVYTSDLNEAVTGSGIDFMGVAQESMEGLTLVTYGYIEGSIIEAQYDVNGVEMTVRKSPELSGLELSGDYNTYSKTWEVNFKGVNVECNGDGETLNLAYINGVENNYSISYNAGNEGQGLTVDQLQSIVMGLQ